MKTVIKKILCVVLIIAVVCGIIVAPYGMSFLKTQSEFSIEEGEFSVEVAVLNGESKAATLTGYEKETEKLIVEFEKGSVDWFNYFGIKYSSDAYLKGEIFYKSGVKDKSEEFFLEPSENGTFYSFIDNCLNGAKANKIKSISFTPLNKKTADIKISGISTFNREIPEQEIYIEAGALKIGVDLLWGGALSYVEDTDSKVEAVSVDGKIKVDSNAGERYNAEVVNSNINLINRNDTGRLVQQSYYGTLEYDHGVYMDNDWRYNPVQGGNQFNDNSKIVDLRVEEDYIYIKCRPLDWAKEKEFITPSYMEATYAIEDGKLHTVCRFVDFSGYKETGSTQEIPAFYCIEPLDNFVYYGGDKPWTNGELTYEKDLIFWPDAGYPNFYSKENWSAFTGEFEDSFGIGIFVPDEERFLAGIFERGKTTNEDPSRDGPTSYIAVTKDRIFKSFDPYEYEYYIATGDVNEIRESFSKIK